MGGLRCGGPPSSRCSRYYRFGRTRISVEVCKALNWKQENGWLKDRACRDVLRTLSKRELLSLPPPLYGERSRQYSKWTVSDDLGDMQLLEVCSVSGPIRLECVKGTPREKQWNRIVQKYHYLGHKVTVGRCLKFILSANEGILGALSLSESAWALCLVWAAENGSKPPYVRLSINRRPRRRRLFRLGPESGARSAP